MKLGRMRKTERLLRGRGAERFHCLEEAVVREMLASYKCFVYHPQTGNSFQVLSEDQGRYWTDGGYVPRAWVQRGDWRLVWKHA